MVLGGVQGISDFDHPMALLVTVVAQIPEQVLFATSIKKELALELVTLPVESMLERVKPEFGK
jgi:energy-coupling factor transporter ATP-binding protein EcfA2